MTTIAVNDPLAVATVEAIPGGDLPRLKRLLAEHPELATTRLGDDDPDGMSRSLLHVATDWPGHFPNAAATVALLVEAGADINACFHGPHAETPSHWGNRDRAAELGGVPGRSVRRRLITNAMSSMTIATVAERP